MRMLSVCVVWFIVLKVPFCAICCDQCIKDYCVARLQTSKDLRDVYSFLVLLHISQVVCDSEKGKKKRRHAAFSAFINSVVATC